MIGSSSTGYMMSVENVFVLILQHTYSCCHYRYRKKEKKYEVLYTLRNKAIACCEIWNNDKNPFFKKEVSSNGINSTSINANFVKIGMVLTTPKCDV